MGPEMTGCDELDMEKHCNPATFLSLWISFQLPPDRIGFLIDRDKFLASMSILNEQGDRSLPERGPSAQDSPLPRVDSEASFVSARKAAIEQFIRDSQHDPDVDLGSNADSGTPQDAEYDDVAHGHGPSDISDVDSQPQEDQQDMLLTGLSELSEPFFEDDPDEFVKFPRQLTPRSGEAEHISFTLRTLQIAKAVDFSLLGTLDTHCITIETSPASSSAAMSVLQLWPIIHHRNEIVADASLDMRHPTVEIRSNAKYS
ncbi:hypothetical protein PLICRDRAFT_180692 [Plicaturopsis crispa FD-325 SS-3]|uniref:Uncharacterized protein n=1 Tax=Plicaturopsis crispa FD-325 SS-3 TaxID=944288 RepID=A0A0C9T4T2_PLICR|nr:hypothetical protein PLICRDRAFT_180692 [Plicaturopsis crispa FD-325 SS-3]